MDRADTLSSRRAVARVATAAAALLLAACPAAGAQKRPGRVVDPPPAGVSRPAPRVVTSPTTGALVVVSGVSGAAVTLYAVSASGKAVLKSSRRADADGNAAFSSLRPGRYRVEVSHPDHDDVREEVRVVAGKAETIAGRPAPRFGHVVVAGPELTPEATIEVDGRRVDPSELGRGADGSVWLRAPLGRHEVRITRPGFEPFVTEAEVTPGGEAMVAAMMEREWASVLVRGAAGTRVYLNGAPHGVVPETGELAILRLASGREYELRFELDDHRPLTKSVRPVAKAPEAVEAALEPLPTSGPFEETFLGGLSAWDAPGGWRAAHEVLTVEGEGLGLAREARFRDFEMIFGLRLVDPRGAAWVLRARDEKNHYLFVLGGPGGRFPNQLRSYVVRDGRFDPQAPATAPLPVTLPLLVGETYRVRIRAEANVVQLWLTPSRTGEEVSVGLFTDVKRHFPLGRIGFAAPWGEAFQINGLTVRPTAAGARR